LVFEYTLTIPFQFYRCLHSKKAPDFLNSPLRIKFYNLLLLVTRDGKSMFDHQPLSAEKYVFRIKYPIIEQ